MLIRRILSKITVFYKERRFTVLSRAWDKENPKESSVRPSVSAPCRSTSEPVLSTQLIILNYICSYVTHVPYSAEISNFDRGMGTYSISLTR